MCQKIIPFYIGIYFLGYIITPDLKAPLEKSFVWLIRGHGYEENTFYKSKNFFYCYWQNMELKEYKAPSYGPIAS
ncbi:MAG: hypothetical protein LBS28_01850 [Streptococcaceae bacterium]|jgi:hypothetical protein|nr:hypothetical protein [Streptococcaceae bacterium]